MSSRKDDVEPSPPALVRGLGMPPDPQTGAIIDLLRAFTTSMNRYVEVRGTAAGMHRTDLHALAHVMDAARAGREITPSELADAVNLSSPATSALLSRLEAAGHVQRSHSASDRRRVTVHISEEAMDVGRTVFMPLALAIAGAIEKLSPAERDTVAAFLSDVVEATAATTPAH